MAVPGVIVGTWRGDPVATQSCGDRKVPLPREVLAENTLDDWGCDGVDLKPPETLAVSGLTWIWMGTRIGKRVAIRWTTAEKPSFMPCLGEHGRTDADFDPIALTLGHASINVHDEVMGVRRSAIFSVLEL